MIMILISILKAGKKRKKYANLSQSISIELTSLCYCTYEVIDIQLSSVHVSSEKWEWKHALLE